MERHFYALLPDQEVSDLTDELRQLYYPRSLKLHPPHIALVPPFRTDNSAWLWQEVKRLAKDQQSFRLRLDGLGVFPNEKKILHLRVGEDQELTGFRDMLVSAAGGHLSWSEFSPHLSIGRLSGDMLEKAMKDLADRDLKTSFTGKRLVDFREKENGVWEIVHELELA